MSSRESEPRFSQLMEISARREQLQEIADTEIESNWDQVVDKSVSSSSPASTYASPSSLYPTLYLILTHFASFDNMDLKPELLRGIYAYG